MAEYLKNNPIALRHCLLYEFLHKKPVEIAFSDFCKTVRPEVINEKEFQFWFEQFKHGLFNDNQQPIDNMVDILRNNKQALRVCVLYEWATWKNTRVKWWTSAYLRDEPLPVFVRYDNFCKVIGHDVMEYREFDFWFYRFFNGEFELNYERDRDKKMHELMDMPIHVMEKVVEYLDILDRIKLARTSRSFRTFVEDQKLFHQTLKLNVSHRSATISLNKLVYVQYSSERNHCTIHYKRRETFVRNVSFWKQAFLDLNSVLKNPKLHLNILEISLELEDDHKISLDDLETALKFTHYLNVENVFLVEYSWELLARVLPKDG